MLDELADPVATNGKAVVWAVLPEVLANNLTACREAKGGRRAAQGDCAAAGCWFTGGYCVRKPRQRPVVDCSEGRANVGAEECKKELNCIWSERAEVRCQKPRWQLPGGKPPYDVPAITPRVAGSDCGWSSMQPSDCTKRGCLWRQPEDNYGPWCVYP